MGKRAFLLFAFALISLSILAQSYVRHTVKRGETLSSIAKSYKVAVADILAGNPEARSDFRVGMVLNIPANSSTSQRSSANQRNSTSERPYTQQSWSNTTQNNNNESWTNTTQTMQTNDSSSSTSSEPGIVGGSEGIFVFDTENKIYGLRMTSFNEKMFGVTFGMTYQFVDHGTGGALLGLGWSPNVATGPVFLGFNLFPYVSLASYDKAETNSKGKTEYKTKYKVSYGAALEMKAGFKLGKKFCVFGCYEVAAPEFETKDMFKAGVWGVGLAFLDI